MKIRNKNTGAEYSSKTLEAVMCGHVIYRYCDHQSGTSAIFFCNEGWEEVKEEE